MTTAVGDDRNDTDVGPARRGGNPPPDFTIRTLGTARITSPMAAMLEARRTT